MMKALLSPKNNFARNIGELMYEHDMTDKEIAQILEISIDEWMDKKQFREQKLVYNITSTIKSSTWKRGNT